MHITPRFTSPLGSGGGQPNARHSRPMGGGQPHARQPHPCLPLFKTSYPMLARSSRIQSIHSSSSSTFHSFNNVFRYIYLQISYTQPSRRRPTRFQNTPGVSSLLFMVGILIGSLSSALITWPSNLPCCIMM